MLTIVATLCVWTAGLLPASLDVPRPPEVEGAPTARRGSSGPEVFDAAVLTLGRASRAAVALVEGDPSDTSIIDGSVSWSLASTCFVVFGQVPLRHQPSPRLDRSPILRC